MLLLTNIEVAARAANALDVARAGLEPAMSGSEVSCQICETLFLQTAQAVCSPEGVGVDVAEVVDVGDVDARGIADLLRQFRAQMFFEMREVLHTQSNK